MNNNIDWMDLYIIDLGASQINDKEELKEKRNKIKMFYKGIISPLYIPFQDKDSFSFSVPTDKLTCRNIFDDLINEYKNMGYTDMKSILENIIKYRPNFTKEKLNELIGILGNKKEGKIK